MLENVQRGLERLGQDAFRQVWAMFLASDIGASKIRFKMRIHCDCVSIISYQSSGLVVREPHIHF